MQNNKLTFDGNAYRIELSSGVVYEGSTTNLIAHFSVDTITICDRATKLHIPIMSSRANILEIDGEVKTFEQAQVAIEDALSSAGGASSADKVSYDNSTSGLTATNVQDAIDAVGANLGEITPKVNSLMSRADVIVNSAENVAYGTSNVKDTLDEVDIALDEIADIQKHTSLNLCDEDNVENVIMYSDGTIVERLDSIGWGYIDIEGFEYITFNVIAGDGNNYTGPVCAFFNESKKGIKIEGASQVRIDGLRANTANTLKVPMGAKYFYLYCSKATFRDGKVMIQSGEEYTGYEKKGTSFEIRQKPISIEPAFLGESDYISKLNEYESINITPKHFTTSGVQHVIRITNQAEFDAMQESIKDAIGQGKKNICVKLSHDGILYYSENHLNLITGEYTNATDVSLSIVGSPKCYIIAGGSTFNLEGAITRGDRYVHTYSGEYNFLNSYFCGKDEVVTMNDFRLLKERPSSTGNNKTDTNGNTIYEFKVKLYSEDIAINATHLELVENYIGRFFKITKIEGGYAYFYDVYGLNERSDIEGKIGPANSEKYRLLNATTNDIIINDGEISISMKYDSVHECKNVLFAKVGDAFKSVLFSGINFYGAADREEFISKWNTIESEMISIDGFNINASAERFVSVHSCNFKNIKTRCVVASNGSCNIEFSRNNAERCYKGVFIATEMCRNIYAYKNNTLNTGLSFTQSATLASSGKQWVFCDNVIRNYGYTAISGGSPLGLGNMSTPKTSDEDCSYGIIERNLVINDDDYVNNRSNLMGDGGAIYSYEWAKMLIVRNNVIRNYRTSTHMCAGIYMDGYMSNYAVYGNLIMGVFTHYSTGGFYDFYTHCSGTNALKGKNRFVGYNVFTGLISMTCATNDNSCYKALNYRAIYDDRNNGSDRVVNVENVENDYSIVAASIENGRLKLHRKYYGVLKTIPHLHPFVLGFITFDK